MNGEKWIPCTSERENFLTAEVSDQETYKEFKHLCYPFQGEITNPNRACHYKEHNLPKRPALIRYIGVGRPMSGSCPVKSLIIFGSYSKVSGTDFTTFMDSHLPKLSYAKGLEDISIKFKLNEQKIK